MGKCLCLPDGGSVEAVGQGEGLVDGMLPLEFFKRSQSSEEGWNDTVVHQLDHSVHESLAEVHVGCERGDGGWEVGGGLGLLSKWPRPRETRMM